MIGFIPFYLIFRLLHSNSPILWAIVAIYAIWTIYNRPRVPWFLRDRQRFARQDQRRAVFGRFGHKCYRCSAANQIEVDHVLPWSKGGRTEIDNLVPLCHRCNQRKGTRYGLKERKIRKELESKKAVIHHSTSSQIKTL